MGTSVEVTLSEELYRSVERLAQLTDRAIADVLAETLALSLPSLNPPVDTVESVPSLPDESVLALADAQLPPAQDRGLSRLLDSQQAGTLSEADRAELGALMRLYRECLLRKSRALNEAVRRASREDRQVSDINGVSLRNFEYR